MATELNHSPPAQSSLNHPALHSSRAPQSGRGTGRRHSLPLHFLPPGLWSANASAASLVESEEAARGEHILDERTVATRISALRQLNGSTRGHRYTKSTGARSSTFSQPVIVRTYSGSARPRSQKRDLVTVKRENGLPAVKAAQMELKLPPVEAFSFKGIMDEIRHGVTDDLERIAEICARSKYSLSNQYEVHMPPHGQGEAILIDPGANGAGPTLQAIGSDDEQTRQARRLNARRARSAAYGTLETIMSSSRSSDEDKSKKKPAAVLAEEVRGRAALKQLHSRMSDIENAVEATAEPADETPRKRLRSSKSATFASIVIDNAQAFRSDDAANVASTTSLVSEPARPQTSTAGLESVRSFGDPTQLPWNRTEPRIHRRLGAQTRSSVLGSLTSWLPWVRHPEQPNRLHGGMTGGSHAEGSLRDLLKFTDSSPKGKAPDRS